MSQRKLQQEIDRVFKKVKEGLEEFNFIYEKLQAAETQSLKEKYENDLKREIKKLQRSREQIKNWMSGNEVKDKKPLIEHRKLIEAEMERFKEVEKIMKTKAFSKEGLSQSKMDPKEKEKSEVANFIQSMIEELERQDESIEAQIDQIQSSMKKGKRNNNDSIKQQISELQEFTESHKFHLEKLENILRLLENGSIEPEQIKKLQEDIQYYVESNQDDDFFEDDTIYDELGLDELDDAFMYPASANNLDEDQQQQQQQQQQTLSSSSQPTSTAPAASSTSSTTTSSVPPPSSASNLQTTTSTSVSTTTPSQILSSTISGSGIQSRKVSGTSHVTPTQITAGSSSVSNTLNSSTTPTSVHPPPPAAGSWAATAQLANGNSASNSPGLTKTNSSISIGGTGSPRNRTISLANSGLRSNSPGPTAAAVLSNSLKTSSTPVTTPKLKYASAALSGVAMSALNNNESNSNGVSTTNLTKINNNSQREATASPVSTTTQSNKGQNSINNSNDATNALLNDALNFKNLPKEYSSYINSLDAAKERLTSDKPLPLDYIYPYLESSLLNCPDSYDADKSRKYNPINPYQTQSFFPQEPVVEIVGSTKLLTKLEVETLAYCFYYNSQHYKSPLITSQQQQQTDSAAKEESDNEKSEDIEPPINSNDYLQYITAKEFRNRGWKYHKELHTWFHKAEEDPTEAAPPIGLSNSNGNGDSWKYFDYRDTWMIRRKDEFSFDGNLEETDYFNN